MAKTEESFGVKFFGKIITSIIVLPFIVYFFPSTFPFNIFEFWKLNNGLNDLQQAILSAWPIFAWGSAISTLFCIFTSNDRRLNRNAEDIIVGGGIISLWAGVVEEITFRWLFFFDNIVSVKITNFFFFGFLGFGLAEWFHLSVFGPLANFMTLGWLETYIFYMTDWAVGAAMLTTNAFFRDGHKYQGWFGFINSWFCGMYFFWIMFHYGLLAAMLVHFLYDLLIFTVHYADAVVERALGWT